MLTDMPAMRLESSEPKEGLREPPPPPDIEPERESGRLPSPGVPPVEPEREARLEARAEDLCQLFHVEHNLSQRKEERKEGNILLKRQQTRVGCGLPS